MHNNSDFQAYRSETLNNVIKKLRSSNKPLAIWGCGAEGKRVLEFLHGNNLYPDCFMDSDPQKQWSLMEDKYPIVSPMTVLRTKSHYVVVSSVKFLGEMKSDLIRSDFVENIDCFFFTSTLLLLLRDIVNANYGYCPICENETTFVEIGTWLRSGYRCLGCGTIPRQRSLIRRVNSFVPRWKELIVHEASPSDISLSYFAERCPTYSYSFYYPEIPRGSNFNGVRCEDLESLTYTDNSIDIFITQDVFEHIMNPELAFREIERVLKVGGYHIFSVPIYGNNESIQRAKITPDGIAYLAEPEYHGSFLVAYHHSLDIIEKIGSNMLTTIVVERDRNFGIDGEFLDIFICKKIKPSVARKYSCSGQQMRSK